MADEFQKPSIGRVVHFYDPSVSEGPIAAFITAVYSDTCVTVAAFVHHATGVYVGSSVQRKDAAGGMSMYWEWPPRV